MQQAGYHHANMLARQLEDTISTQGTEMLDMLRTMQVDDNAPNGLVEPPAQQPTPLPNHAANAAVQPDAQLEMLRILQSMQQNMNANGGGNGSGRGGRGGRGSQGGRGGRYEPRTYRRTPDDATFHRQDPTKYCSTHGGCNHTSPDCTRQAPGHNNSATRENRLGGSNAFCQPIA